MSTLCCGTLFETSTLRRLEHSAQVSMQFGEAEQLGIFENPPLVTGQFTPDTLDPGLNKILEEFGLSEKLSTKASIKGKLINFRDFVKKMVDDHDKSTLDLIDAEIIQEPIRIRIRD